MSLYKLRALWIAGVSSWIFSFYYAITTGDWIWALIPFLIAKVVAIPSNHIAMHRYFTHRSFTTGKWRHIFLTWSSVLVAVGSPILYATSHRHHHRHSDEELDIHSPKNSILESLGLWEIKPFEWFNKVKKVRVMPTDLFRDPTIKFVHRNYFKIWGVIVTVSLILGWFVTWKIPVFITFAPIGWYVFGSGVFVTTLAHLKIPGSYRPYETTDNSYNHKWIHWYTMGEGLHNNHHAYPGAYDQAMHPGEFDLSGWIVKKFFVVDPKSDKAFKV